MTGLPGHRARRTRSARLAQPRGLKPGLAGGRDADGEGARGDQSELADAFGGTGRIQCRQVRADAVREQVEQVKAQVLTQSLDIID
jgi:hypothetical protein